MARVLTIYLASRVVTTVFLAAMFLTATGLDWPFASVRHDPNFFTFSGSWDSSFYRHIALDGYPRQLPVDDSGHVQPNAWAFLPLFPLILRGVMSVTGLDFYLVGVVVAAIFGAAATLVLYRLVASRVGERPALWAAAFFSFGPLSFVLQVAYAESLFLFLVFCALWAMTAKRYLTMIPFGVLAAFTRPGALALALALAIVLVIGLVRHERMPVARRLAMVVSGVVIAAAGLAWPIIASAATGHPGAYLETEMSWWTGFVGRPPFVPLTPWFVFTSRYAGVAGIALVLVVVSAFAWWLRQRGVQRLGRDIVAYSGSYGLYLFAVFLPQQSLFRVLMPLAPLLGDPWLSATRGRRRILLGAGIALQPVAIVLLWFLGYP
ncbi:hypothetical protein OSC27_11585 [Microbacterium sp. STN6]|uniref:hypothetical protein n=1 Tax=Microbacterium sp. STN6 TaxID=2995588 RepID=UPI0022610397|nr:hypothetical protein [Microbacterium sp. STN6]MCX7522916.1 hypothetical protein [Microbacterium sp. STN6]